MNGVNFNFKISVFHFRVIYIIWTLLSILFTVIIHSTVYLLYNDLPIQGFSFVTFPSITISILVLATLLPLNLILFYLGHFYLSRMIVIPMSWLPFIIMIAFGYWAFSARSAVDSTYVVLIVIFWLKQISYLELIHQNRGRKNVGNP